MRTFVIAGTAASVAGAICLVAVGCSQLDPDEAPVPPNLGVDASYTDAFVEPPVAEVSVDAPTGDANCTGDAACCGDGVVQSGESCDVGIVEASLPGHCPTKDADCDDHDPCTQDSFTGAGCAASCKHDPVTTCGGQAFDGCCPSGCNSTSDSDCSIACGNGAVESGEVCDPGVTDGGVGACPSSASDCASLGCGASAYQAPTGDAGAALCQAACVPPSTGETCGTADGCCPPGCSADPDCASSGADCVDLAVGGVATSSGGSSGAFDPSAMVDGLRGCNYHRVTASSIPGSKFIEIEWDHDVTIGGLSFDVASAGSDDCGLGSGHALEAGVVQVWDGSQFVNAGTSFAGKTGSFDLDLTTPKTTRKIRINALTATNTDAVIHEWYVWPKSGCTLPAKL